MAAVLAAATAAAAEPDDAWRYRVADGDTLIGIAAALLVRPADWRALQRLNRVANPRRLLRGSTLRIPLGWLRTESTVAEVVALAGSVRVVGADGGSAGPVTVGATLRAGDTVHTGEQSSLTLRLADGTLLLVTPGSQLALTQMLQFAGNGVHATSLRLLDGSVETNIPGAGERPRFEIRTPVMNLGVRGTEFRTRFDSASTTARTEVLRGKVAAAAAAAAAGETALPAGFGLVGSAAGLQTPTALLPAPELAGVPARVERLPLRFEWPAAAAAQGWRAQVLGSGAEAPLLLDGRFDNPSAVWPDLPDGRYVLRVRAVGASGLEGVDASHAFTLKARPEPPFTVEPENDATFYGPSVRFGWTLSAAAAHYRLQVASEPGFSSPAHDLAELAGPSVELPLSPGRWYWRLASVRADGDTGPWGDPKPFTLREVPPAPAAQPPEARGDRLRLRWTVPRPGDRVQFQMVRGGADADFSAPLVDRLSDEGALEIERPGPGSYRLRARTVDADGVAGPWGPTATLELRPPWWWWLGPLVLLWLL